jgi:hypothetical protein
MEESKEVSEEAPRLLDDPIYLEPIKFEKEKKA